MIAPDNLPDWLSGIDEPQEQAIAEADALPGDIPDWLRQASAANLTNVPAEAEADLGSFADLMDSMDLPDWLRPPEPVASAAPQIQEIQEVQPEIVAPPPPVPEPIAVRPAAPPPAPEPIIQRQVPPPPTTREVQPAAEPVIADIPANHAQRLRHARELVAQIGMWTA